MSTDTSTQKHQGGLVGELIMGMWIDRSDPIDSSA